MFGTKSQKKPFFDTFPDGTESVESRARAGQLGERTTADRVQYFCTLLLPTELKIWESSPPFVVPLSLLFLHLVLLDLPGRHVLTAHLALYLHLVRCSVESRQGAERGPSSGQVLPTNSQLVCGCLFQNQVSWGAWPRRSSRLGAVTYDRLVEILFTK